MVVRINSITTSFMSLSPRAVSDSSVVIIGMGTVSAVSACAVADSIGVIVLVLLGFTLVAAGGVANRHCPSPGHRRCRARRWRPWPQAMPRTVTKPLWLGVPLPCLAKPPQEMLTGLWCLLVEAYLAGFFLIRLAVVGLIATAMLVMVATLAGKVISPALAQGPQQLITAGWRPVAAFATSTFRPSGLVPLAAPLANVPSSAASGIAIGSTRRAGWAAGGHRVVISAVRMTM